MAAVSSRIIRTERSGIAWTGPPLKPSIAKMQRILVGLFYSQKVLSSSPCLHLHLNPIIHIHGPEAEIESAVHLLLERIRSDEAFSSLNVRISCLEEKENSSQSLKKICLILKPTENREELRRYIDKYAAEAAVPSLLIVSTEEALHKSNKGMQERLSFMLDVTNFVYPLVTCLGRWLRRQYTEEHITRTNNSSLHRNPIVLFKGKSTMTRSAVATLLNRLFNPRFKKYNPEIGPLIPPQEEDEEITHLDPDNCPGTCQVIYNTNDERITDELRNISANSKGKPSLIILTTEGLLPADAEAFVTFTVTLHG